MGSSGEVEKPIEYEKIRGQDVLEFQGIFRWCSNFWPAPVMLDGVEYPTVEHAYQAAKTFNPQLREVIRQCETSGGAKKKAEFIPVQDRRPDWDKIKIEIMRDLVTQKFTAHPHLKKALLLTEDSAIVEGNWHGDRFWGQVDGEGSNYLGMLLMQVRMLLRPKMALPGRPHA